MTEHPPGLDLAHLPHLPSDEVKLLWVNDYWDGPLEGIAEYHGERCLYVVAEPRLIATRDEVRRWVLYPLTPEQLREQEHWHALFVRHVGAHWDCTGATPPPGGEPRDPQQFYEPYREQYRAPVLTAGQAIGWVTAFAVTS